MPIRTTIPSDAAETTLESLRADCAILIRKHLQSLTRVRIERRRQGPGGGSLPEEIEVARDPEEPEEELVAALVDEVFRLIRKDAERPRQRSGKVGAWVGCVVLLNHLERKPELARIDVRIEDPDEAVSLDSESVAIVNVVRTFLRDMCKEMVAVMGASAAREQAIAELVTGVASSSTKETRARYKYEFKKAKLDAEVREHEVDAEARVHRSTATKFMFSGLLERYQPTLDALARMWIESQGGKSSGASVRFPPKPTEEEILSLFPLDVEEDPYRDIRRVALAMLVAEPLSRAALQQQMIIEFNRLGNKLIEAREVAESKLGKQRVGEIVAWFRHPWD